MEQQKEGGERRFKHPSC